MEEVLSEETIRIVKSTAPAMKQVRVWDGSGIPFPPFLPNREKTLSVRKHPILRLTTSSLSSLMTQHGYRIITHMYSTLFAEHPEIASMFRKEDHTVQPGESYERQPLLVAQAVRHSLRFLFLALTRFSSFSSFLFQVHAYAFHIDNLTALEPAIQR